MLVVARRALAGAVSMCFPKMAGSETTGLVLAASCAEWVVTGQGGIGPDGTYRH